MISHSEYTQDVTILMTSMQHHFWIPGVLNVFDKDNITKISSRYTNKAWGFNIMQSSQKHPRLEIGLRE